MVAGKSRIHNLVEELSPSYENDVWEERTEEERSKPQGRGVFVWLVSIDCALVCYLENWQGTSRSWDECGDEYSVCEEVS